MRLVVVVAVAVLAALAGCGRTIGDPNNRAPVANAGVDLSAIVGVEVGFDGSGSSDVDGTVDDFAWDFGDGTTAEGKSTRHAFSASGGFVVTLTVTDDDGATATDTIVATVADALPFAVFTADPTTVFAGQDVSFDASASGGPQPIVSYDWVFGDGATASGVNVVHAYQSEGAFTARLTVTDSAGVFSAATDVITVNPPDVAGTWDVTPDSFGCASYTVDFPDTLLLVTQDGANITAAGANGRTWTGTLDDGDLSLSTTTVMNAGSCGTPTVTVNLRGTMSGGASFTATATAFFDLAIGCQCTAAWNVTGTRR